MERKLTTLFRKVFLFVALLPQKVFAADDGSQLFDDLPDVPDNPTHVMTLIKNATNIVLLFAGICFFAMLLWGGITLGTAGGNEERVSKGKKILTAAIVGFLIVVLAGGILFYVTQFFGGTIEP